MKTAGRIFVVLASAGTLVVAGLVVKAALKAQQEGELIGSRLSDLPGACRDVVLDKLAVLADRVRVLASFGPEREE